MKERQERPDPRDAKASDNLGDAFVGKVQASAQSTTTRNSLQFLQIHAVARLELVSGLQNEVRTEEGDHLPIEFNMEDCSVEAFGIGASSEHEPVPDPGCRGQEGEVPSISHRAQLGLGCKVPIDGRGVIGGDAIAAKCGRP